jgi:hypothetical protein
MKKTILLVIIFGLISVVKSYSQDSTKTMFHVPKIQYIGVYVAPEFQYGQLKSQFTSLSGFSGMVLLNNKFGIGATMEHSIDRSFSPSGIKPLVMNANVGGLKLEYVVMPQSAIHCSFNLMVGGGSASADSANNKYGRHRYGPMMGQYHRYGPYGYNDPFLTKPAEIRSDFMVVQPGMELEANLFKYVKLFAGANYRYAVKGNHIDALIPASTLQGFSANVGLKIGLFDFNTDKFRKSNEK